MPDGRPWPTVTIVTPSFNQGSLLEETIRSVLLQGYPRLEYFVMDGGSTDNSIDIIKKYAPWLTGWTSGRDGGQSDAINRGIKMGTGSFAGWINSDDLLCKGALVQHARDVGFERNVVYVGYCVYIDENGDTTSVHRGKVSSFAELVRIRSVWRAEEYKRHLDQPAVLFPRDLFVSIGGLNVRNQCTMDYELWGEFFLAGATFRYTEIPFAMYREHPAQRGYDVLRQTESLIETAARITKRADTLSEREKTEILADLDAYLLEYKKSHWRGTGRLAKLGLPPWIVNPVRRLRERIQNTSLA
jgi:glycosyltransferase involved in cell wall biosynthesis